MKKLILAAVLATLAGSTAFAQSYNPGYGTANIAPVYTPANPEDTFAYAPTGRVRAADANSAYAQRPVRSPCARRAASSGSTAPSRAIPIRTSLSSCTGKRKRVGDRASSTDGNAESRAPSGTPRVLSGRYSADRSHTGDEHRNCARPDLAKSDDPNFLRFVVNPSEIELTFPLEIRPAV
jgi:hypothetical protein